MRVFVLVFVLAICECRTVVHSTQSQARAPPGPVKDVSSRFHVAADLMDVTQRVLELPEQTVPVRHSQRVPDLEEDAQDPANRLMELPEQSVDSTGQPAPHPAANMDLEEGSKRVTDAVFDEAIKTTNFNGVVTATPDNNQKVTAGTHWGSPGQFTTAKLPKGFHNPIPGNRGLRAPTEVPRADGKMMFDSRFHDTNDIKVRNGDYQINIHHNHGKNFLDARRVQIGTSLLGAHTDGTSRVARYRVSFMAPFQKTPIVLVTTVPESAHKMSDMGPHPDVFAASVSEIRLDHFVVNVMRLDSFPDNSWGQSLYLDWIALEYNSDFPQMVPQNPYMMVRSQFSDLEQSSKDTPVQTTQHATVKPTAQWDE